MEGTDNQEMLETAYELESEDPYIIDSIGWAYYLTGDYLRAEEFLKRAVEMDYMEEKEIKFYQSFDNFLNEKKDQRIVLMTTKASISYADFKFDANDTILFGRESAGVPENIHKIIKNRLKIPMKNNMRSLNIASSVAIILAESLKQTNLI